MLLVLGRRRLARHHLHLHRAWQKQLLLVVLQRVHAVLALGPAVSTGATTNHVVLNRVAVGVVVCNPGGRHGRPFGLLVVVLVKLVDVERAASLVHVHISANRALDLNGLRAVTLLRVQLAPVRLLHVHYVALLRVDSVCVVGRGHDGAAGWVEAKIGLVHKLLVEA